MAGLPNITGAVATGAEIKVEYNDPDSALYGGDDLPYESTTPLGSSPGNIYLDASRNNPIFGRSTTVMPASVSIFYGLYLGRTS